MSDLVPRRRQNPLPPIPRGDEFFLGGALDALGDAGQAVGNFVKDNPKLTGTLAGAVAAPFTGGLSLQAGTTIGGLAGQAGAAAQQQASGGREERARRLLARRRRLPPTGGTGSSGSFTRAKGGAVRVSGRDHEQGGIRLPGNTEVEGGETVGQAQGGAHAFSKRLKVPGTDRTFADMHEELVQRGASQERINQLADLQDDVAGRSGSGQTARHGGQLQENAGTSGGENLLRKLSKQGPSIQFDFAEGGRLDEGGEYHAVKASETSGDDPKFPINSADDVRDAWKLRNHAKGLKISQEKLENRIKRKAREFNVDLPTDNDSDSKGLGGGIQHLPGINVDRIEKDRERNTKADGGSIPSLSGFNFNRPDIQNPDEINNPVSPRGRFPSAAEALLQSDGEFQDGGLLSFISELGNNASGQRPLDGGFFNLVSGGGGGISGNLPNTDAADPAGLDTGADISSSIPNQIPGVSGGNSGGSSFDLGQTADRVLPFLPGAINATRGLLGDAEGIDIPRLSIPDRSIDAARNFETDIDVEPQIAQAEQAFRSLAADPNISDARKQAAFSDLIQQRAQIRSQEENKETQLENQRQQLVSKLIGQQDRAEAQANQQAAAREEQSEQKAEAAKQNLLTSGITQIAGARQRQKATQQAQNRNLMAVLASMAGAPQPVRENVLGSILPLIQNEKVRAALEGSISGS